MQLTKHVRLETCTAHTNMALLVDAGWVQEHQLAFPGNAKLRQQVRALRPCAVISVSETLM